MKRLCSSRLRAHCLKNCGLDSGCLPVDVRVLAGVVIEQRDDDLIAQLVMTEVVKQIDCCAP